MNQPNLHDASIWDRIRDRLEAFREADQSSQSRSEALAAKLAKRARLLRQRMVDTTPQGPQLVFLGFMKGRERFGVLVEHVLEVQPLDHFGRVPGAPGFVLGIVQHRGAILSLLDLGILFEAPQAGLADVHLYIVIEAAGRRVAVAATGVDDVAGVSADEIKSPPHLHSGLLDDWVVGVHEDNRVILRMDRVLRSERVSEWRHA